MPHAGKECVSTALPAFAGPNATHSECSRRTLSEISLRKMRRGQILTSLHFDQAAQGAVRFHAAA
jgi:hypothetical protein